ncbi:hypothetical protein LCGC14_1990030 [marine sediment metagenome]|uniref:Uncharacterized protein n=1 Tax=marine sediment metagenome TaxID=412755 RepID=A0A0F9I3D8_9ZZZZ
MMRILISLGVGFVTFLVATMFLGNPVIGFIIGIAVGIILVMITDKDSIEKSKQRRHERHLEEKENRKWARESYHKERGKAKAGYDQKRQEEYDSYDELNPKNIIHSSSKIRKRINY